MAKTTVTATVDHAPVYTWWTVALLGVGLGIIYWLLAAFLQYVVLSPQLCGPVEGTACSSVGTLAGSISAIIVAVAGLFATIKIHTFRPLIVVVAVAITLWGLYDWTAGLFWLEGLLWCALLYGLGYLLYSLVTKFVRLTWVLVGVVLLVLVARVIFSLTA